MNKDYIVPLTASFPPHRLGPTGDVAKVNCATCHAGQNKPLAGLQMAKSFEGLIKVSAPMPALPAPVAEERRAVLFFDVGSPVLKGEQAKGLDKLVAAMAGDRKMVATISGYHSAAGTLAQNQELAKQRAFTVRDAMIGAGITEARVKLEKPQKAEANLAGEDPAARRVEVTLR
jgi:photosynthetic reaction center cytochrome c subunit